MIVNIGTKEYGYKPVLSFQGTLNDYLDNVSSKYSGDFVEANKRFARDVLAGKDLKKYAKFICTVGIATLAILTIGTDTTMAMVNSPDAIEASTHINLSPLDKLFGEVYWAMVKILMYLSTPVWAWVGYILAFGGANNEKRTLAKKTSIGLVAGTGIAVLAPFLRDQLFKLWELVV